MRSVVGSPRCVSLQPSIITSLAGKRTTLIVTTGSQELRYRPRGINGSIDEILFPIQHGFLYYPAFDVVPPFMSYRTGRIDEARSARITQTLAERLDTLFTATPIPFHWQNAGDCDIPALMSRDGVVPGKSGFATHLAQTSA